MLEFSQKNIKNGTNLLYKVNINKNFNKFTFVFFIFIFLGIYFKNYEFLSVGLLIFCIYYIFIPNFAYLVPNFKRKYLKLILEDNQAILNKIVEVLSHSEEEILFYGHHDYKNNISNNRSIKSIEYFDNSVGPRIESVDEHINILINNLISIRILLLQLNVEAKKLDDIKYSNLIKLLDLNTNRIPEENVLLDKLRDSEKIAIEEKKKIQSILNQRISVENQIKKYLSKLTGTFFL